jgi:ribosomal protein L7/L12
LKGGQKGSDTQPLARPDPQGQYAVVLQAAGSNKIASIKAVRTLTGFELGPAKDVVTGADRTPQVVARYADQDAADRAVAMLQSAVAPAEVRVGGVDALVSSTGAPALASIYVCHFCETVGSAEFCENCGAPRKVS